MLRLVEQSMQARARKTSVTEIAVKERKHPQAALTFDDGPDIRYTPLLQASQKISGSREDVEKFLLKDDKRKQDYYRKFAGGQWSDATNYDLCLNSGKLGFDKCVDAIETQLKIMLGK